MLDQAMEVKRELATLTSTLKEKLIEAGIPELEEAIKVKKEELESILSEAVSSNILEEGSLRILDEGRTNRHIIGDRLKEYDPAIFSASLSFTLKTVESMIAEKFSPEGLSKKDLKAKVDSIMEDLCEKERKPKYTVVDLLDGD